MQAGKAKKEDLADVAVANESMKAKFDVICFDVDSTLVTCEGVDWLAKQRE